MTAAPGAPASSPPPEPSPPSLSERGVTAIASAALLGVLALVLFMAMRSPLKDDIAWLLYVARKWLAGRELYVDLVEVNPPLIIWLSALPVTVARWLGVMPRMAAVPFFATLILASAWGTAGLLRHQGPLFANRVAVFAVIAIVMLLIPGPELGQREHLLTAAVLPYLAALALSLRGQPPARKTAFFIGIVAGLGCALKPRYALAFAAVELLALLRGVRIVRPMTIGAGGILCAYIGIVVLAYPAYQTRAVPLAMALYGATDVSLWELTNDSLRMIFGMAVLLLLLYPAFRRQLQGRHLLLVLATFGFAAAVVCFIDGKNWFYHRLPTTIVTALGLVLWLVAELFRKASPHDQRSPTKVAPLAILAGIACVVFAVAAADRLKPQFDRAIDPAFSTEARLERLLVKEKAHTYIAFSEWIALGFPVVDNTGVSWASRFDSMWALKGELWRAGFDPQASRTWPVRDWVARDFVAGCPDIAVVDTRGKIDYIAVLSASDPAFAHAWTLYQQIAAFDGLRIFRRQPSACYISPLDAIQLSVQR